MILHTMKELYKNPEMCVEDMLPAQLVCDSFVGGLEDTTDDPIII